MHKLLPWLPNAYQTLFRDVLLYLSSVAKSYCAHAVAGTIQLADFASSADDWLFGKWVRASPIFASLEFSIKKVLRVSGVVTHWFHMCQVQVDLLLS